MRTLPTQTLIPGGAFVGLLILASFPAQAAIIKVSITVDNSYALFYGTQSAATTFVGSNGDWTTTETYNFNLPDNNYLYIVTASDVSVAQGFLGQFENLTAGFKFYSNDPQWQVMATGLRNAAVGFPSYGAPYSGSAADLALLTSEIQDANANLNPSVGWKGLTAGPVNGSAPWGLRPNIDAAARWVWYSANGDPDPTTPAFDHQEWLVFRIALAATPDVPVPSAVPEPGTASLFSLGLAALGAAHLRRVRPRATRGRKAAMWE